ncbi:MAG: lytic murein transglycosylase [Roseivivax sp.]|nr:lytic murein transglycosylase [Roseivivax sp.]
MRPGQVLLSGTVSSAIDSLTQVSAPAALAPRVSLMPRARPGAAAGGDSAKAAPAAPERIVPAATQAGFDRWIAGFRGRALKAGISAAVFDRAFRTVRYDPEVIEKDRRQSEFTKGVGEYLESAASDSRVSNGKQALRQQRRTLDRIEAHYGVDRDVVVAIWGMESAYGARRGDKPVIAALATLAYDGRRGRFFEQQLVAALKILQRGDTTSEKMTGSWAGAMGHTQFIPTSYQALAVDFTGDGRRDIWSDDPTDALASTANYLAKSGWRRGQPWGVEVRLPRDFDYALAGRKTKKMPSDWARLGVTGTDGRAVPDHGSASVLLPAGGQGPAFLIFRNFDVIARYNNAEAYVIGVGHLSDRITGGPRVQAAWPKDDRGLTRAERMEMQRLLTARGFNTGGIDGRVGPMTAAAIRAFQKTAGMAPDGFPSLALLKKLR